MTLANQTLKSATSKGDARKHQVNEIVRADKETREHITPFAFKIHPGLLGIPLASPARRAIAIVIDTAIVGVTAQLGSLVVALIAAIAAFFSVSKRFFPTQSAWLRILLKSIAALVATGIVIALSLGFYNGPLIDYPSIDSTELSPGDHDAIAAYTAVTGEDSCDDSCIRRELTALHSALGDNDSESIATMSSADLAILNATYHAMGLALQTDEEGNKSSANWDIIPVSPTEPPATLTAQQHPLTGDTSIPHEEPGYSVVRWAQGLLEDLGLGFGWAAAYFTLFPVLWKGQTPGKRLLGIRVVALSGNYLNIWDSFGRYGGYGAGLATGLLGFAQIYWDPNRQAIHDKISGTVVIRGTPTKIETNSQSITDPSIG